MGIKALIILKGIPKMETNEIKKHFKITKDLNSMLQEAVKITGTTETSLMKIALWNLLKDMVNEK